jgi:amino acid permease
MSANQPDSNGDGKKESDTEKGYEQDAYIETAQARTGEGELKRQLKNRHIAMISIGGVIGTGLFLVSSLAVAMFSTLNSSLTPYLVMT